jgi:L-arabinose isomerase
MKKLLLVAAIAISTSSFAQSTMKEDIDVIQGLYGKDKKDLVNSYMKLTGTQSTEFWKIYDQYEVERKVLGQEKIKLIGEYAKNYTTLSEAKADELAKANFNNIISYDKLLQKYYGKTKKVIGSVNAAKFVQLESYLQTEVRSQIQNNIPFIGEIDRTKSTKK